MGLKLGGKIVVVTGATANIGRAKRRRTGPLERSIGRPEDISAAVLYLASERAGLVTGQVFAVDGGTLL
jgi:NAD(P)-dependent dehydrogenase (short-subunit alcohol dehydrogenase family)